MEKQRSIKTNIVLNVLRQISTVVFPLILIPYITRVLEPDNYGRYNFCLNIIGYFCVIGTFGIQGYAVREAAVLRGGGEKGIAKASEAYTINICFMLMAYILLAGTVLIWHPGREYLILVLLAGTDILFRTISREWIFTVFEDFSFLTACTLIMQAIRLVMVFILVRKKEDLLIFALIDVCINGLAAVVKRIRAERYLKIRPVRDPKFKTHLGSMAFLCASSLLVSIYLESDITMLGAMKGDEAVGIYSLAAQIYTVIKRLINAIIAVILPRMALYYNRDGKEQFDRLITKTFNLLSIVIFPAICGLFLVAGDMIAIIAGDAYQDTEPVLKILSFALLFAVLSNVWVSGVLLSSHNEKISFFIVMISAFMNIVLNFILIPEKGCMGAAVTTLISEAIVAVCGWVYAGKLISFKPDLRLLLSIAIGVIFIIAVCSGVELLGTGRIPGLMIKIMISVSGYCGIMVLFGKVNLRSFEDTDR